MPPPLLSLAVRRHQPTLPPLTMSSTLRKKKTRKPDMCVHAFIAVIRVLSQRRSEQGRGLERSLASKSVRDGQTGESSSR